MAKYKLTLTIRNKILNCKEAVQAIIVDDEISFSASALTCDCERSTFRDEHHGQIITGDLKLITNTKRRSLLSNRPNYREPNTKNYSKCKIAISSSVDNYLEKLKTKYNLRDNDLND